MSEGIVLGTIVNAMLAYMSVYHFEEAMKCCNFVIDTYTQDAEIYYRKAQILYFNKNSSIEELETAIELLKDNCLNANKP